MKIAGSFVLICVIFGCSKKVSSRLTFPSVSIHYVDTNYNDLFNYSANGYVYDSIRAYSYQNGNKIALTTPSIDYPYGFGPYVLYPTSGIQIGDANGYKVDRYTVTIIHLKPGVDDTLKMHFADDLPVISSVCDGVWYNGIPIKDSLTVVKIK